MTKLADDTDVITHVYPR